MSNLEDVLKSIVLGGVGAVATVLDKGAELGKTLVEKGQQAVESNQEAIDCLKQKVKDAVESAKEIDIKLDFDFSVLSREQRDALRQKLDEADAKEEAEKAAEAEQSEAAEEAEETEAETDPEEPADSTDDPA